MPTYERRKLNTRFAQNFSTLLTLSVGTGIACAALTGTRRSARGENHSPNFATRDYASDALEFFAEVI